MSYYLFFIIFLRLSNFFFFFFNDTATTEIYTLSLHDALPICHGSTNKGACLMQQEIRGEWQFRVDGFCKDRKSTRLNSSHSQISYAVFCLKKKKKTNKKKLTYRTKTETDQTKNTNNNQQHTYT